MMLSVASKGQSLFTTNAGKITFYSYSPLENIDATTNNANCFLNFSNNEIASVVAIKTFHFQKALMEEHFNEKYLESDKYPTATFKGKIAEPLIRNADTSYAVSVNGIMTIHGVENPVDYTATYSVKNGQPSLDGSFDVALKDYEISVPKIVIQNIAEVIKVTCSFNFKPYEKKIK
jgi:hypothetical protein